MNDTKNLIQFKQWLHQLQTGSVDEALTKEIINLLATGERKQVQRFVAALQTAEEDAELATFVQACLDDEINVATTYPIFDMSFLPSQQSQASVLLKPDTPTHQMIQEALARGLRVLRDVAQGINFVLHTIVQHQENVAPIASRGREQLLQYTWEEANRVINVIAFADDEAYCQIDVSIFEPGKQGVEMSGIPVTLRCGGEREETKLTQYGVVEFTNVPRSKVEQVVIRVAPVPSQ